MCTLSWLRPPERADRAGGYHLFFNRDEQRVRGPEIPPSAEASNGVRYLAPRDSDHGGTWIVANELGVTVCVLNAYAAAVPDDAEYTSRGLLVASLADCESAAAVAERLATDVSEYRPFLLVAVDPSVAVVVEWDGRERHTDPHGDDRVPFVSSAFREGEVRAVRVRAFGALPERTPHALETFHRSHAGGRGPNSPCMHRDDGATRSLTRVDVGPDAVVLTHTAGAPCRTPASPGLRLPRRMARPARS